MKALYALLAYIVHNPKIFEYGVQPVAPIVVFLARGDVHQILCKASLDRVDGHIVVVENNEQIAVNHGGVVQPLISQTSGHGTITDLEGNALSWASSGGLGFRGSRKSTSCR